MGLLSQLHTVASTPVLLQEWPCVAGCSVLETDDVRADVCADEEDKDRHHLRQSVVECFLPTHRG